MHRETLRQYLHNAPLVAAIEQKKAIDQTRRKLLEALAPMREASVSEAATQAVQDKCDEYRRISQSYANMIESMWGVGMWYEAIIVRYIEYSDSDIDRLPEKVKE